MRILGRLLANRRAGENTLAWHTSGLEAPGTIELTSTDFTDGSAMPQRTAGKPIGDNVSPALAWSAVPSACKELVLIVEDADVPFSSPITHAASRLDPAIVALAPGDLNDGGPHGAARAQFGRRGYHGPRPIPGHGPHAYVFQLFALDIRIPGDDSLSPATVVEAMRGHVIARGRLTGTYER
ncbi:YbhB/YbcL family Raf kinase inhibitor-like protein [Leifsonia sp. NPDC058292]|uniref:YbhB/YbcL family Raf kinase inhibitor-like protein n=1 Tax=Leifsonia sp. NPDC058292 TaxID=3346428 RepID=UPI0036DE68E2